MAQLHPLTETEKSAVPGVSSATLADLTAADWLNHRDLLESFVVQQLIAQATWTEPDLRFWHYRDKDQGFKARICTALP